MGYVGDAGLYVQQSVIDAAQSAEGLALEYYKSYNASTLFERVVVLLLSAMKKRNALTIMESKSRTFLFFPD